MKTRRKKPKPPGLVGSASPRETAPVASQMSVAAFLNHNPKNGSRSAKRSKLSGLEIAESDASKRAETGEWEDASARSFVGLYAMCHRMTYGVEASDLREKFKFNGATKAATKALHDFFDDDKSEFVEFIKWTWEREKGREEWAARESKIRGRMGIRLQFSAGMITDYRVESERRNRNQARYRSAR